MLPVGVVLVHGSKDTFGWDRLEKETKEVVVGLEVVFAFSKLDQAEAMRMIDSPMNTLAAEKKSSKDDSQSSGYTASAL